MSKTITQKILFRNTTPAVLYGIYMVSKKHAKSIGAPARISSKVGGSMDVYDGYIKGKNLHLVKNKLIVQTWRGGDWQKEDPDSVFIILFEAKGKDCLLHVTHANLPDKHANDINKGWHTYYWIPWKKYLSTLNQ
jgi:activator of HSP90 ATPase